jgi:MFS family permease
MEENQAAPPPARRTWLTRTVLGFGLASLFSDMGHEMATALMPGFLASFGAPPIALGAVEGVSNLAQNLAKLWSGSYADTSGARRPALILGYAATGLKALFALATSWWWVLIWRTLGWIGRGARGPIRDATIADTLAPSDYGKAFGLREAMDTVGAITGPLAAAALLSRLGYRALFGWSLVPAVLAVLAVVALVEEPWRPEAPPDRPKLAWSLLPVRFRHLLVAATVFAIGNVAPTFFILRASTLLGQGGGSAPLGAAGAIGLYVIHNAFYAAGAFPGGAFGDRLGPRRLLVTGYALFALAMIGFAWGPPSALALVPMFILTGMSVALVEVQQSTWASQLLPPERRGTGLGMLAAALGVGNLVSSLLMGALWTWAGVRLAFAVVALFSLAGAILLIQRPVSTQPSED